MYRYLFYMQFYIFNEDDEETENSGLSQEQLNIIVESSFQAQEQHIQENCPICLDSIQEHQYVISLPCNHVFHTDCITRWFNSNSTCPLCRTSPIQNDEDERPRTSRQRIRFQINEISSILRILLVFPQNIRQTTTWNTSDTIVDLFKYIQRGCIHHNANLCLTINNMTFKSTEAYSYLNQSFSNFGISNGSEVIIRFF